eukprot:1646705-Rhodomonas_salina.1
MGGQKKQIRIEGLGQRARKTRQSQLRSWYNSTAKAVAPVCFRGRPVPAHQSRSRLIQQTPHAASAS